MVDVPLPFTLKTFSSEKRWFCCWADILVEFVRVCWMGAAVCKGSGGEDQLRTHLGTAMVFKEVKEGRKGWNFLALYGEKSFDVWRVRILSAFMCRERAVFYGEWYGVGQGIIANSWLDNARLRHLCHVILRGYTLLSLERNLVRFRFKILACSCWFRWCCFA